MSAPHRAGEDALAGFELSMLKRLPLSSRRLLNLHRPPTHWTRATLLIDADERIKRGRHLLTVPVVHQMQVRSHRFERRERR